MKLLLIKIIKNIMVSNPLIKKSRYKQRKIKKKISQVPDIYKPVNDIIYNDSNDSNDLVIEDDYYNLMDIVNDINKDIVHQYRAQHSREISDLEKKCSELNEELEDSQEQCQYMINFDCKQKEYIIKLKEQIIKLGDSPISNI